MRQDRGGLPSSRDCSIAAREPPHQGDPSGGVQWPRARVSGSRAQLEELSRSAITPGIGGSPERCLALVRRPYGGRGDPLHARVQHVWADGDGAIDPPPEPKVQGRLVDDLPRPGLALGDVSPEELASSEGESDDEIPEPPVEEEGQPPENRSTLPGSLPASGSPRR